MQLKEIIGQKKAKEAFLKMVSENRLPHALILKGKPGIGKLAFANAIAQFVNCEAPTETDSCGKCASCSKIRKGIHPDVRFILPIITNKVDGKNPLSDDFIPQFREQFVANPYYSFNSWVGQMQGENKQVGIRIAEIRELKRKISLKAFEARYKVVIIWNAEKINTEAANAMLKLLEEPPERTMIIMTVSDTSGLLTTINSRCQRIQMHRIDDASLAAYLKTSHGLAEDRALQIAQLAEGSVSEADEMVNESNRSLSDLYMQWLRLCHRGEFGDIQDIVEQLSKENKEFQKLFLSYALQKLRDSLLFSFHADHLAATTAEEREFQQKFSKFIQLNGISELSRLLEDSLFYISRNASAPMVLSVLSLRMHSILTGKVLI
ncbi:MAG: DNA polymerase III subunit delta' [Bacteroidetes bacterium]|jgi:DNA polymerase-3 subunit delta'|nr:DNA polymerase III subunit delta' [Bacteroidota bacterium]MBL0015132.1 DNA polymerase III subunit delta' [Bacteroidota bacterium]MBP6640301.1 DNA polymerase III subunit delta' [Bacteroidia bacterium]MBP8074046.1 DNA polymerase III subunit delta' [Bacteroidia bacterium]